MIKKTIAFTLAAALFPIASFAEITLTNNTAVEMTGKTPSSPCSSMAGDSGIIKPHGGTLAIPKMVMDLYCSRNCTVNVYASRSCSGNSIATVSVDYRQGITEVSNHNSEGYVATGAGQSGEIHGGPSRKWYDVFKIFG